MCFTKLTLWNSPLSLHTLHVGCGISHNCSSVECSCLTFLHLSTIFSLKYSAPHVLKNIQIKMKEIFRGFGNSSSLVPEPNLILYLCPIICSLRLRSLTVPLPNSAELAEGGRSVISPESPL